MFLTCKLMFSSSDIDHLCLFILQFQVPSTEIDKSTPKFFSHWDPDSKMFTVSILILELFHMSFDCHAFGPHVLMLFWSIDVSFDCHAFESHMLMLYWSSLLRIFTRVLCNFLHQKHEETWIVSRFHSFGCDCIQDSISDYIFINWVDKGYLQEDFSTNLVAPLD